jgi:SAM-dependent methyltransferase
MRLDKSTYRSIVEMLAARRPGIDEVEAVYSVASSPHDEPAAVRGGGNVAAAGVAVRDRMGVGISSGGGRQGWGDGRGRGRGDGRGRGRGGDPQQHQQSPDAITRDAALRLLSYLSSKGSDADYTSAGPGGGKPVDSLDVMFASSSIRFTMHVPTTSGGLARPAVPDADSIAIRKERVRPAVGIAEYKLRFNMKSEVSIPIAEALQAAAMATHAGTSRTYRLKKRYSFFPKVDGKKDPNSAIRIDLTAVRQLTSTATSTPTFAQVARAPERYEVEVECVDRVGKDALQPPDDLAREMLSHFSVILKVLDDTDEVMSVSECKAVLAEYGDLVQQHNRFVGPKPVTLERKHLFGAQCAAADPPQGIPCATHDYTVTDKADGERRMMFVSTARRVYTINDRLVVRDTGLSTKRLARCLLDGEFLPDGRYLVFDAYHVSGQDVRDLPLMLPSKDNEDDAISSKTTTRRRKATKNGGGGDGDGDATTSRYSSRLDVARRVVDDIELDQPGQVAVKEFRRAGSDRALSEACRHLLLRRDTGRSRYHVDGLILTPATTPVPKAGGTWSVVLKWKPPDQNTIDFQVRLRPPGENLALSAGGGEAYAIADLLVGQDPWLATPLTALEYLSGRAAERLRRMRPNSYEAVEFAPPASLPLPPEDAAASDAAATSQQLPALHVAFLALASSGKNPRCANGDEIVDGSVVEFAYDSSPTAARTQPRPARWRPLRVRWDKVEAQLRTGGVTANNATNAYSVWASIVRPITEETLQDPQKIAEARAAFMAENAEGAEAATNDSEPQDDAYYVAQIRGNEDGDTGAMRRFHNHWVKRTSLLMRFPASKGLGRSVFDFGCGRGGDLGKWLEMGSTRVVGIDKYANGLYDPSLKAKQGGAYVRLMQAKGEAPSPGGGGRGNVNPAARALRAVFLPMDGSDPLQAIATIDALPPDDRDVGRVVFGLVPIDSVKPQALREFYSFARNPFDLATCMFAIHYFFSSRETLDAFARNVAQQLRPGGHFCGCCLDGDRVDALLAAEAPAMGASVSAGGWRITRRYAAPAAVPAAASGKKAAAAAARMAAGGGDNKFGRRIDVLMDSIGQEMPEFLVDLGDLDAAMSRAGLRPPTQEEASALALSPGDPRPGTGTFDGLFEAMRRAYPVASAPSTPSAVAAAMGMSEGEKRYSFLNRWFVYVKA